MLAALGAFVLRFDWFFRRFQHEFIAYPIAAVLLKPLVFYAFRHVRPGTGGTHRFRTSSRARTRRNGLVDRDGALVSVALVTGVIEQFARSVVPHRRTVDARGGRRAAGVGRIVGEARAKPRADAAEAGPGAF